MTPGETSELTKNKQAEERKGELFVLQWSRRTAAGIAPLCRNRQTTAVKYFLRAESGS